MVQEDTTMSILPDFVEEQINEIIRETGISADELRREYKKKFNNPLVQEDEHFKTDKERHQYAIKILYMSKVVLYGKRK